MHTHSSRSTIVTVFSANEQAKATISRAVNAAVQAQYYLKKCAVSKQLHPHEERKQPR
jgi:hypothetical protein